MNRIHLPVALGLLAATMAFSGVASAKDNDLGSPVEEVGTQAKAMAATPGPSDYRQVVERSFPRYEKQALKKRFQDIKQKYPRGRDNIKLWSPEAIEHTLGLSRGKREPGEAGQGAEKRTYSADRARGRVFVYDGENQPAFMTETEGKQVLAQVAKYHERLLEQAGITKDEILFKKTNMMLMQSMTDPGKGTPQKSEPKVRSIQTYALRAVEGIMVEGSSAKIGSRGPDKVEMMDIKWPAFEYPPQLNSFELKGSEAVKQRITERVKEFSRGKQAKVRMAVVLRPVSLEGKQYFVPSMKVGVQSGADGEEGEGAILYEDLLQQQLPVGTGDMEDEGSGGQQEAESGAGG